MTNLAPVDRTGPAIRPGPASEPGRVHDLRTALGALTSRGRAFVAAGLTALACALALGERDLARIGVMVLLIPLLAAVVTIRRGHHLSLTRRMAGTVVEVGRPTAVHLDLGNLGSRTGLLLIEEQVPWALGSRPRFVIDRMAANSTRSVQYSIRADMRGRYDLGPLLVRAVDPLGMTALHRAFPRTDTVVVVPETEVLPALGSIGSWSGTGENRPQPFTTGSAADSTVREYRLGDDLRRVHWRSTARTGEVMVRREEQPWQPRCTLFIDNRAHTHRGSGPESSLERAVSVAASVAVHLVRSGYQVQLQTADGRRFDQAGDTAHPIGGYPRDPHRPLLEFLAGLRAARLEHVIAPSDAESDRMFIGILGALDEHTQQALRRIRTNASSSYAITLEVATWGGPRRDGQALPGAASLRAQGWQAVSLARGDSLPLAWQELVG